ncbi:MAG: hypothetical protein AAF850_06825 [Pseudomonadota bacterium]
MNQFAFLFALLLTPEAPYDRLDQANPEYEAAPMTYERCIDLVNANPDEGRLQADRWLTAGGGPRAKHCLAAADVATGLPKLAAIRLTELGASPEAGDPLERARIFQQAATVWLDAGDAEQALEAIDAGLGLAPGAPELQLTQGLAYAAAERWQRSIDAITAAENAGVSTVTGLIARANGRMALLQHRQAAEDVVAALKIDPFNVDALVIRGRLAQVGVEIAASYAKQSKSK